MNPLLTRPMTVSGARLFAKSMLSEVSDTARLDADILVSTACDIERVILDVSTDMHVGGRQAERLSDLIARRMQGEPIAYLTSVKEFWSLPIRTTPATLIPRPETELLVERILHRCSAIDNANVADLGTGSGAVALAVASELPDACIVGTDISQDALLVAKHNRANLQLGHAHFFAGDWAAALPDAYFDVIGANPPYVRINDPCLDSAVFAYEPKEALLAGHDGLASIKRIVETAGGHLKRSGWLVLEHAWDQGDAVRQLLRSHGYEALETHCDLSGKERVSEGWRS